MNELIITLIGGTVCVGGLMVLLSILWSNIIRTIYDKEPNLCFVESFKFNCFYVRKFGVFLFNRYLFVYDFDNRPIKHIRDDVKDYIPK